MRTLVWFRGKDLRIADHAPLKSALSRGEVILLFVLDPYFFEPERAQGHPHRIQFLIDSLLALSQRIRRKGSRLIVVKGRSVDVVPRLAKKWRVDRVVAYRWVEPFARERDRRITVSLHVPFILYEGETLLPPGTLRSGSGRPYSVFSPFYRTFERNVDRTTPLAIPRRLPGPPEDVSSKSVTIPRCEDLGITRNHDLIAGGEDEARKRLNRFLELTAERYHETRDILAPDTTSHLSADIKFGTLSVRTIWHEVDRAITNPMSRKAFLRQLVWREFNYSTLWDRPELLVTPYRTEFVRFPWRFHQGHWRAWVEGRTGYPIVDASSRQLLADGFVHNRARMISASFLTKHLMISYKHGEAHYMKYLTDGDWAQNNAGWQWSAGCGCDAQPYFRMFNPITQGQRFDPDGIYVSHYLPMLAGLPKRYVHAPWTAPAHVLRKANVRLGKDYPLPVVDHQEARSRFLGLSNAYLHSAKPRR